LIGLIGGLGRIGRRYQAILEHLDIPYKIIEVGDHLSWYPIEKAIIATPTETHFEIADECRAIGVPYLLEKPPTKDLDQATRLSAFGKGLTPGFIVNNYAFLSEEPWWPQDIRSITYDYYNTGPDGLKWDLCQLLWIAKMKRASFCGRSVSPKWRVTINDEFVMYEELENAYIKMVEAFAAGDHHKLWRISDAYPMVKTILDIEENSEGEILCDFSKT
jgi:hypothetical protein